VQLTAEALLLVEHAEAVLDRLERAEADLAAARPGSPTSRWGRCPGRRSSGGS